MREELMKRSEVNVVGTGLDGKLYIGVRHKAMPRTFIEEYADAEIKYTGEIRALLNRTDKVRPCPGGMSIGHYAITAGTLGCLTPDVYILSNNHVLANSNDAEIGDVILQPGPYDGGTMADRIGTLLKFVPIQFFEDPGGDCPILDAYVRFGNWWAEKLGKSHRVKGYSTDIFYNNVDCALCKPDKPEYVRPEILEVGVPIWGDFNYDVGTVVKKSGRTTGLQSTTITAIDAMVQVGYGGGKYAFFQHQIIFDNPNSSKLAGGDSGSILLNEINGILGLCFAGSDTVGIANDIAYVRGELGI